MKLLVFINREQFYKICSDSGKEKLMAVGYHWQQADHSGPTPNRLTPKYFADDRMISLSLHGLAIHQIADLNSIQVPIFLIADESIGALVNNGESSVNDSYKMLYHTKTEHRPIALDTLKHAAQCSKFSIEETLTPYGRLAEFIDKGATEQEILDFIGTLCSPALDHALNLLHACLTPQGAETIKEADYADSWTKEVGLLVANLKAQPADQIFKPDYLANLTRLREEVLFEARANNS